MSEHLLRTFISVTVPKEILSLQEIKRFMIENPRKILSEAGYEVRKSQINIWQPCDKEFTTKSKFNRKRFFL